MAASLEQRVPVPRVVRPAAPDDAAGLPLHLTRFVGRAAELDRVRELLAGTRLLTLTGTGGSGKTRLAVEAARAVEGEGGGALAWAELSPLVDPSLVAPAVFGALELIEEPGRSSVEALVEAIGTRRMLLVLDNCEHVIDACAMLADRLLRACPSLTILATSREALGVAGETAWLVPPLSLPSLGGQLSAHSLARSEAAALFVDRARAVVPGFEITDANAEAVARICHRLDGVPLAVELAAARVRVLTPAQILERLDDCFALLVQRGRTALPRHQTIRATIDWSYQLLSAEERVLLERLSVFAGGFTLEAAERICAADPIDAGDVLDLVAALVERSLVVMREEGDSARYHLLEVVRQYARDRLAQHGVESADSLALGHARFYAALAEAAGPNLDILQEPAEMARFAAEHDNLRGALEWSLQRADEPLTLRIAGSTWPFWLHAIHWSEGLEWMTRILAGADHQRVTPLLGRVLHGASALAYVAHDFARARAWAQAAERIWREHQQQRYLALLKATEAQLAIHLGEPDAALELARAAVSLARDSADPHVLAYTLATGLGFVHAFRGEAGVAEGYCAEAQEISLRESYEWGILVASFSRAMTAWMHGAVEPAAFHATRCLRAMRRVENRWFIPRVLLVPAAVAARRGHPERAARLLGACDALRSARGGRLLAVEQPYFDVIVDEVRGALSEDDFLRARREGSALDLAAALDEAESVLAAVAAVPAQGPAPDSAGAPAIRVSSVFADPVTGPDSAAVVGTGSAPRGSAGSGSGAAALCVRALGPLEVLRGDELLGSEHWSYAKPRELLVFLLCHPQGATKEQIGRAIWPGSTAAQVRNNLHVTLHFVRKALGGSDWIVYAEERYRLDRTRGVEFDLEAFQAGADHVLERRDDVADATILAALDLYRGDFLEAELFGGWHLELRDRARGRYVELAALLAERRFAAGDHAAAAALYRRLVAGEELREDLYRRLMQCLARTGERAAALRHADRLATLLREELDAEPEPLTLELRERIRRGEAV
jgi:predicted ATPase/DNA-binding SARP family transcriptional activator